MSALARARVAAGVAGQLYGDYDYTPWVVRQNLATAWNYQHLANQINSMNSMMADDFIASLGRKRRSARNARRK